MTNERVQVFYTVDNRYAPYLAVSIKSLIEHTNPEREYDINVIHQDLNKENMERLENMKTENVAINLFEMKESVDIKNNSNNSLHGGYLFSLAVFFRIFLPKMFSSVDKGIYIDSDTVVNDDVAKLYDMDLEGNYIAGVTDKCASRNKTIVKYIESALGIPHEAYINIGVMIMDFEKLRKAKFDEHFMYLHNKYQFKIIVPDQDYINVMLYEKIKYLDPRWNCKAVGEQLKDPGIIHFNLFFKPWMHDVMYDNYFWDVAERTEFHKEILEQRKSTDELEIKADEKRQLIIMDKKAISIYEDKDLQTFKKVFDEGNEKRI